jgi:hypothetical protein
MSVKFEVKGGFCIPSWNKNNIACVYNNSKRQYDNNTSVDSRQQQYMLDDIKFVAN